MLMRSEIPSGMCAKLRIVAASTNRVHLPWSLCCCLFAPHMYGVVLHAHPVRGESYNQRNTTGEVATTSSPFYNEPHRSHVLLCEGWTPHDLQILATASCCCDRKSRAVCAQSFASWQQETIEFTCHDHSVIACSRHIYLWCCSSCTSRSWWITQSTQHHRRGCNNVCCYMLVILHYKEAHVCKLQ